MSTTFIIYPTTPAASLGRKARAAFMVSLVVHFLIAVLFALGIQAALVLTGGGEILSSYVAGMPNGTLYAVAALAAVGFVATKIARVATSKPAQYAAYVLFILVLGVMMAPLFSVADEALPGVPDCAAALAAIGTVALAGIALKFREEYRMGPAMGLWCVAALAAGGLACLLFGMEPATYVVAGTAALVGIAVLYDTRLVLEEYPRERYIAAALELFIAIPLFPWYLLRAAFAPRR